MKYRFILLLLCCLFILSLRLSAHGDGNVHVREMYSVLPFSDDKENKPIKEWLGMITSDLIDNVWGKPIPEFGNRQFYTYLKEEFGFRCKHRLLFHWGFNARPWSEELENKIRYCDWAQNEEKVRQFKQAFVIEQKRRNKVANEATENLFGFASGGKEAGWANGIIAIVYDVHLLGDYVLEDNKDFDGVTSPSEVAKDIINDLRRIDPGSSKGIIDKLKRKTATFRNEHELAKELIALLQKELPHFLYDADDGAIREKFIRKGFKLKKW